MNKYLKISFKGILILSLFFGAILFSGCSKKDSNISRIAIGTGAGALIGGALGKTGGAIAGGVAGGVIGGLINNSKSENNKSENMAENNK